MIDDPLKRKMFAQPVRANQPMGILASSPQLMNAVQGYANGGAVKGYANGGANLSSNFSSFMSNQTPNQFIKNYMDKLERDNRATYQPSVPLKQTFSEPGAITSLKDIQTIKIEPNVSTKNNNVRPDKVVTSEVDDFEKGSVQPYVPEGAKIEDSPGFDINNANKNILQSDKQLKDAMPKAGNYGLKTDESENPYAKISEKYATKLQEANKMLDNAKDNPKIANEWKEKVEKIYDREGKIDLEKIDKLAKESAGIGDNNYDKRRSTAFWMALIKGGLATAGGESSNALTNIAKGLMFGVDSYGKDINALDKEEREDRKEYNKIKLDLIKNEESKLLAHKSLELQYASKMYEIKQNQNNFESKMDFEKAQAKINNEMQFETIEISKAKAWNDMKWKDKSYDLQLKEFKLNKEKQADYVRLTTQQLKDAWDKGMLTDDMKEVIAMGSEYINVDPETGRFESFTDLGQKALVTSKLTGTKVTDLNTVANGHVTLGSVLGVKFLKKDGTVDTTRTKAAGLVWQENFADKWQDIKAKTASGKLDVKAQKAEERRVLQDFADLTGGVYKSSSQTYDINGNPIN